MAVRVVPMIWQPERRRFQAGRSVVLPRLPVATELLELAPAADYEGGGYRVRLVRHTPSTVHHVAADVYLVPEPVRVAAGELCRQLTEEQQP